MPNLFEHFRTRGPYLKVRISERNAKSIWAFPSERTSGFRLSGNWILHETNVCLRAYSCNAAGERQRPEPCKLPFFACHFVSFSEQNRQFQGTNPLISFDDSIDFVQQIHWNCSTIPLVLFRHSAAFPSPVHRFRRFILAFSPAVTIVRTGQARKHLSSKLPNSYTPKLQKF